MARTVDEIRKLLTYYKDDLYGTLRAEQNQYDKFYHDTFEVPWIKPPMVVSRTGAAAELVDEPVEQISAAKLIAYRPSLKETNIAKESAIKVSKLINEDWIRRLMKGNPNPKKECIKNIFYMGESWLHPVHNQSWVMPPFNRTGLPVLFLTPDPRVIYASPNEDENGIPEDVIVFYERMPWIVQSKYPAWSDPQRKLEDKKTVSWLEYWDSSIRYFEADSEPVLDISPNPYKRVPFIHKVSGFGKGSNEGKPEELVVGKLRRYFDLLRRDASSTSDIDSIIHLYANPSVDIQGDDQHEVPKKFGETYTIGAGKYNVIPPGITVKQGFDSLPSPEVLNWHSGIKAELGLKTPSVLTGAPQGATGRLQDLSYTTAMRKYEEIISGQADMWATGFEMALQMCDEMPRLMPDGISSKDLNQNYVVEIELRAEDPLETARKAVDGDRKQDKGIIDWGTNLVKYQGFSQEEAEEVMDNAVIDKIILNDPITLRLLALQNAKERGMEQEYLALEAQGGMPQQGGIGSQGGPPREGNIQTERGFGEIDMSQERRPARLPPNV